MRNFFKLWLPALAWMGLIYYLSDQPHLASGFEAWIDTALRKAAHVGEYFVLAYLLHRLFYESGARSRTSLIVALLLALLYAAGDEWHQTFVPGRTGSARDVAIDAVGIVGYWLLVGERWLKSREERL